MDKDMSAQSCEISPGCSATCFLLGRIALSIIFIMAGVAKFLDPQGTAAYMAANGMTFVTPLLYSAAILELFGGLALLLGWKARWAATLLFLFLIPAAVIFHDFWHASGQEQSLLMTLFLKNVGIMGGLLYIVGAGPGPWSLERCIKRF
jgi:putative oxidoreductase